MSDHCFSDDKGTYKVTDIWKLVEGRKETYINKSQLCHNLEDDCWDYVDEHGETYTIKPLDIIDYYEHNRSTNPFYEKHVDRMMKADISYPIVVMKDGGWYVVVDGTHRLCRYYISGFDYVKSVVVTREELESTLCK